MYNFNFRTIIVLLFASLSLSGGAKATAVLDKSFGTGGKTTLTSNFSIGSIRIQPDNKILLASLRNGASVARLNEDGSLDLSFNNYASLWSGRFGNIRLQPDNKILVSGGQGFLIPLQAPDDQQDFVSIICRLNADGTKDAGFGNNGCFSINRNPGGSLFDESVIDVASAVDGKILAIDQIGSSTLLMRLLPDGSLDTGFGTNGFLNSNAKSLTPVANDKFLITLGSGTAISRIDENGVPDPSFGVNGTAAIAGGASSIWVQPDGGITVAGEKMTRLTKDGQPDPTSSSFSIPRQYSVIDLLPGGKSVLIGPQTYVNNVLFLLGDQGRLIGLNGPMTFDRLASLSNGKFLASSGSAVYRYRSFTSVANQLADLDGDGKTDISVYRPSDGNFYLRESQRGIVFWPSNGPVGTVIPEKFGNALQSDLVWWTPGPPQSCIYGFYLGGDRGVQPCFFWGLPTDLTIGGDYNGDGTSDFTIFRKGLWHIRQSSNGESLYYNWGTDGDLPVPADYDFDGVTDPAIFRPGDGTWWILRSSDSRYESYKFGQNGDKPVPADYDGDGRADIAVYRPSDATWYLLQSTDGFSAVRFGLGSDRPVPGDYDGDGRTDIAVFRPSDGNWYLLQSTNGFTAVHWGMTGDIPLSTAYSAN